MPRVPLTREYLLGLKAKKTEELRLQNIDIIIDTVKCQI